MKSENISGKIEGKGILHRRTARANFLCVNILDLFAGNSKEDRTLEMILGRDRGLQRIGSER
jgi:hypothetical protein